MFAHVTEKLTHRLRHYLFKGKFFYREDLPPIQPGNGFDLFVPPPLRGAPLSKGAALFPIESIVPSTFYQLALYVPCVYSADFLLRLPSHPFGELSRGRACLTIIFLIFPGYALSIYQSASYVPCANPCACTFLLIFDLYLLDIPPPHSRSPPHFGGSFLPIESIVPSSFGQLVPHVPQNVHV